MKLRIVVVVGCCIASAASSAAAQGRNGAPSKLSLTLVRDDKQTETRNVSAADGGTFSMETAGGPTMRILFPKASLPRDMVLTSAPLRRPPIAAGAILLNGFVLEPLDRSRLKLTTPATITFVARGALPKRAAIVRYRNDGQAYEVIPTKAETRNGVTTLTATVDHFTTYGVAEPCLPPGAAIITDDDFPGIITIDDTEQFSNGPMKSSVTINMLAKSVGNTREYKAKATSETTNQMTSGSAQISAPSKTTIPPFSFQLKPTVFGPNGPTAFEATGSLAISSAGTGQVSAGGRTSSAPLKNSATVPYVLTVSGKRAQLSVQAGPQAMIFNGTFKRDKSEAAFEKVFRTKSHDIKISETQRPYACVAPPDEEFEDDPNDWVNDLRRWSSTSRGF